MKYRVRPGDSLWKIAKSELHDPARWGELARLNGLQPPYQLLIGQELLLPDKSQVVMRSVHARIVKSPYVADESEFAAPQQGASTMPGRAFLFVLADEALPSGKLVRKVLKVPLTNAEYVAANPEVFGLKGDAPGSGMSLGEHSLNKVPSTKSPYVSASTKYFGASGIEGRRVYIDIGKAKASGVTIHSTEEILADLDRMLKEKPHLKTRIELIKKTVKYTEGEVLLEGKVPSSAIKSAGAMSLTRSLRFVQLVGIIFTVNDVRNATVKSVEQNSFKPIAAETIRQAGGWGMAWAGTEVGFAAGALVGIETGPGAIITGAVGAIIFGTAGYFGADWVADYIDEN
jgi:LysM repeat protein